MWFVACGSVNRHLLGMYAHGRIFSVLKFSYPQWMAIMHGILGASINSNSHCAHLYICLPNFTHGGGWSIRFVHVGIVLTSHSVSTRGSKDIKQKQFGDTVIQCSIRNSLPGDLGTYSPGGISWAHWCKRSIPSHKKQTSKGLVIYIQYRC